MYANKLMQGESITYISNVILTRYITKPRNQITALLLKYGISCSESSAAVAEPHSSIDRLSNGTSQPSPKSQSNVFLGE